MKIDLKSLSFSDLCAASRAARKSEEKAVSLYFSVDAEASAKASRWLRDSENFRKEVKSELLSRGYYNTDDLPL